MAEADPPFLDKTLPEGAPPPASLESSFELVRRARSGDRDALNRLCERYLPALSRWASGRLPSWARELMNTQDLVQEAFLHTIERIGEFEHRREGALHAYLRRALMNRIQDEIRRVRRRPAKGADPDLEPDSDASPLEKAIGREEVARYESALDRLDDEERELVVGRVELGLNYDDLARAQGKPTANAARMAVSRALLRLAEGMAHAG